MKKLTKKQKKEAVEELKDLIRLIENDELVGILAILQSKRDLEYGGCSFIGNLPVAQTLGNIDITAHRIKDDVCKKHSADVFCEKLKEEGLMVNTSGPFTADEAIEHAKASVAEYKQFNESLEKMMKILKIKQDPDDFRDALREATE